MVVIDFHTHIGTPFPALAAKYFGIEVGEVFTVEDLVKTLDKFKIDMAVTFPLLSLPGTDFVKGWMPLNEYVSKSQKKYPDRIIGFCWLNPKFVDKAIRDLKRCIRELGLKGVKLGPRYDGYFANDPRIDPFYEEVSKLKIPIIYHCGPTGVNSIVSICNVADKFPELKIIIGHMGVWWEQLTEAGWLLKKYENVYLETSGSLSHIMIEKAVELVGPERVMFGTDTPYIEYELEKRRVEIAKLTDDEKRMIMGENACRLLGIKV